jgi:PhnB protein
MLGSPDKAEIERLFNALAKDGSVDMPLGQTFFSELYGMLTDKFGIRWQLSTTPFSK